MTKPDALMLANQLQQQAVWEGHYGPSVLRDLLPVAAAELRRLNAEVERLSAAQAATPAAAEPLTVTRLLDLMPDSIPARHDRELIDFARAVERAHGIGKEASNGD